MEENENKFEVISARNYNTNYKQSNGFGKTVLLPFISGIAGCALVIGTCFGVPSIKSKLLNGFTLSTVTSSVTSTDQSTNLVNISDYSNTEL